MRAATVAREGVGELLFCYFGVRAGCRGEVLDPMMSINHNCVPCRYQDMGLLLAPVTSKTSTVGDEHSLSCGRMAAVSFRTVLRRATLVNGNAELTVCSIGLCDDAVDLPLQRPTWT